MNIPGINQGGGTPQWGGSDINNLLNFQSSMNTTAAGWQQPINLGGVSAAPTYGVQSADAGGATTPQTSNPLDMSMVIGQVTSLIQNLSNVVSSMQMKQQQQQQQVQAAAQSSPAAPAEAETTNTTDGDDAEVSATSDSDSAGETDDSSNTTTGSSVVLGESDGTDEEFDPETALQDGNTLDLAEHGLENDVTLQGEDNDGTLIMNPGDANIKVKSNFKGHVTVNADGNVNLDTSKLTYKGKGSIDPETGKFTEKKDGDRVFTDSDGNSITVVGDGKVGLLSGAGKGIYDKAGKKANVTLAGSTKADSDESDSDKIKLSDEDLKSLDFDKIFEGKASLPDASGQVETDADGNPKTLNPKEWFKRIDVAGMTQKQKDYLALQIAAHTNKDSIKAVDKNLDMHGLSDDDINDKKMANRDFRVAREFAKELDSSGDLATAIDHMGKYRSEMSNVKGKGDKDLNIDLSNTGDDGDSGDYIDPRDLPKLADEIFNQDKTFAELIGKKDDYKNTLGD